MVGRNWLNNGYIMFSKFIDDLDPSAPDFSKMDDRGMKRVLKERYHFSDEEADCYVDQFGSRARNGHNEKHARKDG
ncbi:MAG: hypothetical protein E6Y86_05405 [Slackia sp.]|uniref:hypothetical protein n=1 Tax=uncultured Slackia sp. TaxID=665903 RepID=UPI002803F020|nr:hypothetical protein [uncultured Slackia sp.]MDU6011465.1 hypothetical protein [Slackia sp.]